MLVPSHLNLDGLRIVSSVAGNDPDFPAVHSRSHPCRLPVVGEGSQEKRISWNNLIREIAFRITNYTGETIRMTRVRRTNGGALSLTSFMLLVVSLAVGVCSMPAACAEVSTRESWQMGTPIVTYWAGPMPMTDAVAKQMADGG